MVYILEIIIDGELTYGIYRNKEDAWKEFQDANKLAMYALKSVVDGEFSCLITSICVKLIEYNFDADEKKTEKKTICEFSISIPV